MQDPASRLKTLPLARPTSRTRTRVYVAERFRNDFALELTEENRYFVRALMLDMADKAIDHQIALDNPPVRVLIDGSPLKDSLQIKESVDVLFGEENLDARPAMNAVKRIADDYCARYGINAKWVWTFGSGNGAPVPSSGPVFFEQGGLLKMEPSDPLARVHLSEANIAAGVGLRRTFGGGYTNVGVARSTFLRRITQTSNKAIAPLFRVRMFYLNGGKPGVGSPSSGRFNARRGGKPPRGGNVIQGVPVFYLRLGVGKKIGRNRR